jgi:DNA polymerase III sliding clamp (beta) subunit (PCNA family)
MATKPRARRKPSVEAGNPSAKLIAALKFVSMAQSKVGTPSDQHCMMLNHWLVATNGVMTIGTKVDESMSVCPHTMQFIDALTASYGDQVISQESPAVLSVQAGEFRGLVACVDPSAVPMPPPDPPIAQIGQPVIDALDAVQFLATDGAPEAHTAAVLLQANTAVAMDGKMLMEAWHGTDLPPSLLLPRKSVQAIVKCKKLPTGFGYSDSSVTIWFEDGSFIKTQLYKANYPNYHHLFPETPNAYPLPEGFFKAVHTIMSFSENGHVYFNNGAVASDLHETKASTFKIEGLTEEMGFNGKYLIDAQIHMNAAQFIPEKTKMVFYGNSCRGVIMGLDVPRQREVQKKPGASAFGPVTDRNDILTPGKTGWDDLDDDIPF